MEALVFSQPIAGLDATRNANMPHSDQRRPGAKPLDTADTAR